MAWGMASVGREECGHISCEDMSMLRSWSFFVFLVGNIRLSIWPSPDAGARCVFATGCCCRRVVCWRGLC